MSWVDLAPVRPCTSSAAPPAVEFGMSVVARSKEVVCVALVIRPTLATLPAFLEAGASVRVLRGAGIDEGRLRIVEGGRLTVSRIGGPSSHALCVRVPLWPGLPAEKRREAVAYRMTEFAFEIDLPTWARARADAGRVAA